MRILIHAIALERPVDAMSTTNSSAALTLFGGLYLNAGWSAVFVGMMILGIIAALLYRHLLIQPLNKGKIALAAFYIALAVWTMDIDSSYIGTMVGLIHRFIFFGILFWFLHLHFKRVKGNL